MRSDLSRPRLTGSGVGLFVAVFTFVTIMCVAACVGESGMSDFCMKMLASLAIIVAVAPILTSWMSPDPALPAICSRSRGFFRPPRLLPS
jgi:hypothetical protein